MLVNEVLKMEISLDNRIGKLVTVLLIVISPDERPRDIISVYQATQFKMRFKVSRRALITAEGDKVGICPLYKSIYRTYCYLVVFAARIPISMNFPEVLS